MVDGGWWMVDGWGGSESGWGAPEWRGAGLSEPSYNGGGARNGYLA